MEGAGRRVGDTGMVVLALASLPAWWLSVSFLALFWAGAQEGQTCDPVHQPWCSPGHGIPQYVAVAVLVGLSVVLAVAAAVRRRHGWRLWSWLSAGTAVVALGVVTVAPSLLGGLLPASWFTA